MNRLEPIFAIAALITLVICLAVIIAKTWWLVLICIACSLILWRYNIIYDEND